MHQSFEIRKETPNDLSAIESVTVAAFQKAPHNGHTEQHIIKALREAEKLTLSLVAISEGGVIGHVAVSPVAISEETRAEGTRAGSGSAYFQ